MHEQNIDSKTGSAIVLFDGHCNFCSWWVRFLIARDHHGVFKFGALQTWKEQYIRDIETHPDSVVLIHQGKVYRESGAVLQIIRLMGGWWKVLLLFGFVPRSWRDALYRSFAARRYRWFGRTDHCFIPGPAFRERFL
jgi:predicted DCC family thiol-disulfide oxidoreductase YuxK